jgi:membrane protease YdiL (CAAX protease family)
MKTFSKKILLSLVLFSIVLVPLIVSAEPIEILNPLSYNSLAELVEGVTDFLYGISLVLAPLFIVIAGYFFVTAAGDPNKIETGKKIILFTVIGFIIILLSKGLINAVKDALGVN